MVNSVHWFKGALPLGRVRRLVAVRLRIVGSRPVVLPPEPSGDSKEGEAYRAAADRSPFSAVLTVRLQHFAIRAERFGARRFHGSRALLWSVGSFRSIGNRYPTGDEGKCFGRAVRALLRVMNLVAIQTESG